MVQRKTDGEPQIRITIQNEHADPDAVPLPIYEEAQQLQPALSPYCNENDPDHMYPRVTKR